MIFKFKKKDKGYSFNIYGVIYWETNVYNTYIAQ